MRSYFETRDADLAAYLYARAYPLVGVWHVNELTVFLFPPEAAASAMAFYDGATVPAKNLLQAAHQLESIRRREYSEYAYT